MMEVQDEFSFLDSFFEGSLQPLMIASNKKQSTKTLDQLPVQDNTPNTSDSLISSLSIISPTSFRCTDFRETLATYRFQRKRMYASQDAAKECYTEAMTLPSLLHEFRKCPTNQFYVMIARDIRYFLFENGDAVMLATSRVSPLTPLLQQLGLRFEQLAKEDEKEKILVRGKNVALAYGILTNLLFKSELSFEIVANFQFENSHKYYPVETFRAVETRQEYQYLAREKKNILGELNKQVYIVKVEGLCFSNQIKALYYQLLNLCKVHFSFQILPITLSLRRESFNQ